MNNHVQRMMAPAPTGSRYRGIINFQGIPVGVEVPAGGKNPHSGKKVSVSYGDIPGTKGVDGDPVDVLLGPELSSQSVFVLQDAHSSDADSPDAPKQYGEDKVALGFASEAAARAAWADYYSGDNRAIVGCLVTTVRAIREHLVEQPENRGMPFEVCGGANRFLAMTVNKALAKGGPYIGPRGGKYKDAAHKIPWSDDYDHEHHVEIGSSSRRYRLTDGDHEVEVHHPPNSKRGKFGWMPVRNLETKDRVREKISGKPRVSYANREESLRPEPEQSPDYKMQHQPPDDGPGGHEIGTTDDFPKDILQHPEYYTAFTKEAQEFMGVLRANSGNPNAKIKIYRAMPKAAGKNVQTGNWVTPSKAYAKMHAEGEKDWHIVAVDVPLKDIKWAGDDLMEWGYWGQSISKSIVAPNLVKADGPPKPPAGFVPVEGSTVGGYKKPRASGHGFQYWYPKEHNFDDHPDWVEDLSKPRGVTQIEPGHFVEIAGRTGMYVYAPDTGDADSSYTHVVPYDPMHDRAAGAPVRVRNDNVIPLKGKTEKRIEEEGSKRKPRPPKRKPRPPKPRGPTPKPDAPKPDAPRPSPEDDDAEWSEDAQWSEVFHESRAPEGTILHKLENGAYPLYTIKDADKRTRTQAVFVPKGDQAKLFAEFTPLIHGASREAALSYKIARVDASGNETADFEDIKAGAALGFTMALRNYRGGKPFSALASDYANTYAVSAAREALQGGGPGIPRRMLRLLHGYIAAKHRATANEDSEPSLKAIARNWRVKKADAFTKGYDSKIGVYHDGENVIDQSREELPFEDWHVRGPNGEELGDPVPGKKTMMESLDKVAQAQHVHDSEWLADNPVADPALPSDLPIGTQLHLRREIDDLLSEMEETPKGAEHAKVLSHLFGFSGEADTKLRADGTINDRELAQRLKLEGTDRHTRRLAAGKRNAAIQAFKELATKRRAEARKHADRMLSPSENFFSDDKPTGPSHAELAERFGHDSAKVTEIEDKVRNLNRSLERLGDNSRDGRQLSAKIRALQSEADNLKRERVRIYSAGIRAGKGKEVEEILLKEKAGTATIGESRKVRQLYHEQRDRERLEWFNRYGKTQEVPPEDVRQVSQGTDPNSDWLYTDELMAGYHRAVAKRGTGNWGPPKFDGTPSHMTDEQFQEFMGRKNPRLTADEERKRLAEEVSGAARRDPTAEERKETDAEQRARVGGDNG